ncbi:unnamed protein product [[Candida] boidinii]|uniref:Unnamed protein product n=1 Tax=Candida boidinii TaxID=5477 RepID=A0ACB5TT68_CANBO|nr:unnamed protein product [[Candida] boidinii]
MVACFPKAVVARNLIVLDSFSLSDNGQVKSEELTVSGGGGNGGGGGCGYSMLVLIDWHPILLNLQAAVDHRGEILIFW